MAAAHAPIPGPLPGVSRPCTLLIALPTELVHVVPRNELMNCLKAKALIHAIKCVQSMPNGVFRVTCKTQDAFSWLCTNGITIRNFQCTIMEAEPSYTLVRLFRCPFEVSDEAIVLALAPFGKVIHMKHESDRDFPSVVTGTRLVRMKLSSDIPSRIKVKRYPCNVWYNGQPKTCRICGEEDHEAPTCPYKGKCLRCLQEGHTARNCLNAWGFQANGAAEHPGVAAPAPENEPKPSEPSSEPVPEGSPPESSSSSTEESTSPPTAEPSVIEETPMETAVNSPAEPESQAFPATFDPSASLFSDSPPESTEPSQGTSSPQPLVDKEGFVLVQSRSSRKKAARHLKDKPSSPPRSRSLSCSRARSRSPHSATPAISSPDASVSILQP